MLDKYNKKFLNRQKFRYHRQAKLSSRQYVNPFFAKKKSRVNNFKVTIVPSYVKAILMIVVILTVAAVWFLLYSSFFTIKNIEINNDGKIAREEIENLINDQKNSNTLVFFAAKQYLFIQRAGVRGKAGKKIFF